MRFRACFVFLAFVLGACSGTKDVEWRLAFASGVTPPAGNSVVHAEVQMGGCGGGVFVAFDQTLDGSIHYGMTMPRTLGPGTYGLSIEVRDTGCQVVARGCLPVTLPSSGPFVVTVNAASGAACTSAMCMSGYCGETALLDLGTDAGTMPDLPVDMPGTDLGGGTCNGCMNGSTCVSGIAQHACGNGGGSCNDCGSGLGQQCANRACVARTDDFALSPLTSFLLSNGNVYSAGDDSHMQRGGRTAGPGFTFEQLTPTPAGNAAAIAATQFATCAIAADGMGTMYCWGANASGLLGRASPDMALATATPGMTSPARDWAFVAGGSQHFCALKTDGALYCWGDGAFGQLGSGASSQNAPTPVLPGTTWLTVSCGGDEGGGTGHAYTCAVKSDHTLWCWGSNQAGQLGNSSTTDAHAPIQIGSDTDWITVSASAGGYHTCGIRSPGNLYCWGETMNGTLGLGDPSALGAMVTTPTRVGGDTTWTEVSAGQYHTCGIDGGQGYCWGFGGFGELGNSTMSQNNSPTAVSSAGTWAHLVSSWHWTCGVGTGAMPGPYCWGDNGRNQLGIGMSGSADGGVRNVLAPTAIMPSGL